MWKHKTPRRKHSGNIIALVLAKFLRICLQKQRKQNKHKQMGTTLN